MSMVNKILVAGMIAAALLVAFVVIDVTAAPAGQAADLENADNTNWDLTIGGIVSNPLRITYQELLAMPSVTKRAVLVCVDDTSGMYAIEAAWTGVPLKDILEQAGPLDNALKVAFFSIDGYSTDLDLESAMNSDVLVAYMKDNSPASTWQGSNSLRLVVPGRWGYKWANWLAEIRVMDYDFLGLWESKGESDEGLIPENAMLR